MKELILVRHGKSDWGNDGLKDVDRPLNERGYQDAYMTAQWYLQNHGYPAQIISSPATRALNTALIFAREFHVSENQVLIEPEIYEAPAFAILKVIHRASDNWNSVMLFGHNPGFTDIANDLNSGTYFDNIPTCGMISLKFNVKSWTDVAAKKGSINFHHFPKEYRNKSEGRV